MEEGDVGDDVARTDVEAEESEERSSSGAAARLIDNDVEECSFMACSHFRWWSRAGFETFCSVHCCATKVKQ